MRIQRQLAFLQHGDVHVRACRGWRVEVWSPFLSFHGLLRKATPDPSNRRSWYQPQVYASLSCLRTSQATQWGTPAGLSFWGLTGNAGSWLLPWACGLLSKTFAEPVRLVLFPQHIQQWTGIKQERIISTMAKSSQLEHLVWSVSRSIVLRFPLLLSKSVGSVEHVLPRCESIQHVVKYVWFCWYATVSCPFAFLNQFTKPPGVGVPWKVSSLLMRAASPGDYPDLL